MSEYSDVKINVTRFSDLNAAEKSNLKFLIERYKLFLQIVAKKSDALKLLNIHIIFSIDCIHLMHFTENNSIYQNLFTLKKRLAFTDRARKITVIRRYTEFQKRFKSQNLTQWLLDWKKVYDDAMKIKISDIGDIFLFYDFLNTLRSIDMAYVADRKIVIEHEIEKNQNPPTMKKMIENYQNHFKLTKILIEFEKMIFHSTFAFFQGQKPDNSKNSDKSSKKKRCLCHKEHRWNKCLYLIVENWVFDWTPNPIIEKKINEKWKKQFKLKNIVKKVQNDWKKKSQKNEISVSSLFKSETLFSERSFATMILFSIMQQFYKLINCWILDGENDIHVCNNPERFTIKKLIEDKNIIISKKTTHKIKAFGTVKIVTKTPKRSIAIKVLNVTFVSEYFINLMCLDQFEEKDIFHDSKNDLLHQKDETLFDAMSRPSQNHKI